MIINNEDISKASFRRVSLKTLDHLFLSQVECSVSKESGQIQGVK